MNPRLDIHVNPKLGLEVSYRIPEQQIERTPIGTIVVAGYRLTLTWLHPVEEVEVSFTDTGSPIGIVCGLTGSQRSMRVLGYSDWLAVGQHREQILMSSLDHYRNRYRLTSHRAPQRPGEFLLSTHGYGRPAIVLAALFLWRSGEVSSCIPGVEGIRRRRASVAAESYSGDALWNTGREPLRR